VTTQGSLPGEDAALILLFSLVASGQITLRRIDGWRKIATVLSQHNGGGGVMILRTAFAVALALDLLSVPLAAEAQPARIARIGVLNGDFPNSPCLEALRRGLSELGNVEGRTYVLDLRWAEGRTEQFARFAADLVGRKMDLIVVTTGLAVAAVSQATSTIPIVMTSSSYPVEQGLIASLARPGGNITGMALVTPGLMAKRLQLLKEALSSVSRVAVLRLPGSLQGLYVTEIEAGAQQLGIRAQVIEVGRSEDLPGAFQAAAQGGAAAIMTTQSPFFLGNRAQIAELALKHRLPSLSGEPNAAEAGTLLFYGPPIWEGCQRAAKHVDKILKGAKPADLPVEQPTKFELVINLKTANALGLTIPPSLLVRADHVIE
jgi:ABC-type uncharacterized transport system substrate-binding protein